MTEQAMNAAPRSILSRVARGIVEFFLLGQRLREARARDFERADPALAQRKLGFSLLRDAQQLGNSETGRDSALLAYRTAVRLLLPVEVRRGRDTSEQEPWSVVWLEARAAGLVPSPSPELEAALESEQGEAMLARASSSQRDRLLTELRALAQRLSDVSFASALSVERLVWLRRFRVASVGLLVALALSSTFHGKLGPKNLALHRPVTLSDKEPFLNIDPRHLVDDDDLNLGFHAANRENAYVTIDLESVVAVARVDVFNRSDCCQERAVPLSVQISSDGVHFTTVERRERSFHDWHVHLPPHSRARYVRLQHEGYELFHLAEVRVY